jgi:glyoxylase-like metal-dependent hydrolase (beta-lactamase superfamily II)
VATLELDVYTSPIRELTNGGLFSPTTSTLVKGPEEVVLVDAQYMASDVDELADRIDASGRRLTTIYVTHPHADHYFGLGRLLERYPRARAVARPQVVDVIRANNDAFRKQWRDWFDGAALDNTTFPEVLVSDTITVDGEPLHILDVGQADCAHNTVVHIPSLDAVITGDIVYNGVNPFLAETGPDEWLAWSRSVEMVGALAPKIVVAGHKQWQRADDDLVTTLEFTRNYLVDFIVEADRTDNSRELVSRMQDRHPDLLNPSALVLSAVLACKRKKASR